MKQYVVTGAYVTVKTMTHQGPRILGLMAGAPVPVDAGDFWIQHHLDSNLIEEVPEPEPVKAEVKPEPEQPKAAAAPKAAGTHTAKQGG